MGRIYSIDFLRGLMASLVMIYHFTSWSLDGLDSSSVLSRFGLYAVCIFYIISGYALAHVYSSKGNEIIISDYCTARFFRIAPLFYIVSLAFLCKGFLVGSSFDVFDAFLNFSFLFAIVDPSAYLATGAWSIGNEMFFYLLLLIAVKSGHYKRMLVVLIILSVLFFVYFRLMQLDPGATLPSQWNVYINPLNHVLFFTIGMLLRNLTSYIEKYKRTLFPIVLFFASFIFVYPVHGDRINLVTGWISFLMATSSISIFLVFLMLDKSTLFSKYGFKSLGDISYSVYLLHPLVWFATSRVLEDMSFPFIIVTSVIVTIMISWISFHYFEKPAIRFGKRYVRRVKLS